MGVVEGGRSGVERELFGIGLKAGLLVVRSTGQGVPLEKLVRVSRGGVRTNSGLTRGAASVLGFGRTSGLEASPHEAFVFSRGRRSSKGCQICR